MIVPSWRGWFDHDFFSTIERLHKRIDFLNSFGNVEVIAKDLKCKTVECETLRQVSVVSSNIHYNNTLINL